MVDRPKRRKMVDNPYNLKIINNNYYIIFKSSNKYNKVEVTKEVFELMDMFELDDLKELNEFDRHIEHSELTEYSLCSRMLFKQESIEDLIVRETSLDDLRKAINMLPEVQRRRIKLYYFDELTEKEIAKLENVSQKNISKSLTIAKNNLKEILKKLI